MDRTLKTLPPELTSRLAVFRREWRRVSSSTAPGGRAAAEQAARALYAAVELKPPASIRWASGPAALIADWLKVVTSRHSGRKLKTDIFAPLQARAASRLFSRVSTGLNASIARALRPPTVDPLFEVMSSRGLAPLPVHGLRSPWTRLGFRIKPRLDFLNDCYGQRDFPWLAPYAFYRDVVGLRDETADLAPVLDLAHNAGWILPTAEVCWLIEKPTIFATDEEGRPHSGTGPAIAYADGSRWYAWKGIPLSGWSVEEKSLLTARAIENEPDLAVRRCLIEVVGAEAYIAMSRARCVAEDQSGKLWQRPWPGLPNDGWAAVEVINGTPEPDGTLKHYFLQVPYGFRSARAAVAWTYGMGERDYAELSFRT